MVEAKSQKPHSKMKQQTNTRKTVKFAATREIITRPAYASHDQQNSWLSRQEYKAITDERRSSLQTLRKAGFDVTKVDEKEHCPWGLEPLQSAQHMKLFKARHRSIVQAVLAEQKFQRIVSRPDPECLRLISTSFSRVSLESALERAAQDARKVEPSVLVEMSVATPDHHVLPAVRGTESLPTSNSPRRKRPRIVSLQA